MPSANGRLAITPAGKPNVDHLHRTATQDRGSNRRVVTDPDEIEEVYAKEQLAPVSKLVRRTIASFREPAAETARRAGVDRKTVLKAVRGERLDRIRREALERFTAERAREILKASDQDARVRKFEIHDETLLTRYLEQFGARTCAFNGCPNPPRSRSPFCSREHANAADYQKRKVHKR